MPTALIYVIDMAKRDEYPTLKNFIAKAGYDVRTAVGSRDVNVNYQVDLETAGDEEVEKLAAEYDLLALAGGYKMYYHVLKKRPPLKNWDLNINIERLNALVTRFSKNDRLVVAPLAVPGYLAQLGLLRGKNATVYPITELIRILRENGANFVNQHVVKDRGVVTVDDITTVGEKEFLAAFRETA